MLPPPILEKSWRVHLCVPGVLATVLPIRWAEFYYTSCSLYIVELVCFDLRKRRDHDITRPYADDPPRVQDAIDRVIVDHYEPHREREGALIELIFQRAGETAARGRSQAGDLPPGEMVVQRYWVFFPAVLAQSHRRHLHRPPPQERPAVAEGAEAAGVESRRRCNRTILSAWNVCWCNRPYPRLPPRRVRRRRPTRAQSSWIPL
jgi:hypothetical protein